MYPGIVCPRPEEQRYRRECSRLVQTCALACIIGLMAAGAAFALQAAIALATNLFIFGTVSLAPASPADHHLGWFIFFIPPLGGVIVGLLARYGSPAIRGHGIPETMERIRVGASRIAPRVAFFKPVATAISIGSGGPFGAEGPIIMTGGALGSLLGQAMRLTAAERKVLLAAGSAAGMAATFGCPVAAVFLAIELLLFEFRARSILPVSLACAVAAGARWSVTGAAPLFPMPPLAAPPTSALPWFAALGVGAGLLSVFLSRIIYLVEDAFDRMAIHWMWWPALGGLVVGGVGLVFPQALGIGAEHLQAVVAGKAALGFALAMLVCKLLAWSVSLGSGTAGGVLAPLMLIGASLGGALAGLAGPHVITADTPGLWAVVCMAAVFAGATRTPLTSVIFALELTHEVNALLPLLVACAVSDLVSLCLLRHSIITEKIARRGVHVVHDYELDALGTCTVAEVMTTAARTVPQSLPLAKLYELLYGWGPEQKHHGYPVVDAKGRLRGIVTRSDLPDFVRQEHLTWLVAADVMSSHPLLVAYPDEPLRDAAERMLMSGVGRLPVVSPDAPDRLVGLLARGDLFKALARRNEEEHRRERTFVLPWPRQTAVKQTRGMDIRQ
jgi:H+/Cl- antiporter ClcA